MNWNEMKNSHLRWRKSNYHVVKWITRFEIELRRQKINWDVVNLCWAYMHAFNSLHVQRSNGNGKRQKIWEVKLFARCSVLVTFCLLFVTFCSLLVTFCSLLVTFCSLLVTFCLLLVTFCLLLVTFCSLLVTFYSLLNEKFWKTFFWVKVNKKFSILFCTKSLTCESLEN